MKFNGTSAVQRDAGIGAGQASCLPVKAASSRQSQAGLAEPVCERRADSETCATVAVETFRNPQSAFRIPPRRRRGFTLVEIMLALAIFTMLMGALYATWVLVIRATSVGKGKAARLQRERIAMSTLEDSLTCIQSHQASIEYYEFIVANGDAPELSFTAYLPDDFPRSGEFINDNPSGLPMDFHMRRLTYSLRTDDDGRGKDLVLQQSPMLMEMSTLEQNNPLVLAKNVSDFLIECWDTNTMQWDTEWDATNTIPTLVRVTLAFDDPNPAGQSQVVTREVSFPSTTMPTIVQTPNGGNFVGGQGVFNSGQGNNPGNVPANGQSGSGSVGTFRPQSMSIQGQPPDLGPPMLPETPPSRAP